MPVACQIDHHAAVSAVRRIGNLTVRNPNKLRAHRIRLKKLEKGGKGMVYSNKIGSKQLHFTISRRKPIFLLPERRVAYNLYGSVFAYSKMQAQSAGIIREYLRRLFKLPMQQTELCFIRKTSARLADALRRRDHAYLFHAFHFYASVLLF